MEINVFIIQCLSIFLVAFFVGGIFRSVTLMIHVWFVSSVISSGIKSLRNRNTDILISVAQKVRRPLTWACSMGLSLKWQIFTFVLSLIRKVLKNIWVVNVHLIYLTSHHLFEEVCIFPINRFMNGASIGKYLQCFRKRGFCGTVTYGWHHHELRRVPCLWPCIVISKYLARPLCFLVTTVHARLCYAILKTIVILMDPVFKLSVVLPS